MKKLRIIILILGSAFISKAQTSVYPVIGQLCPNVYFSQVAYDSKPTFSLADYRGKWLILDFWNRYCTICLNRMPGKDSLQKKFREQLKVVLVGYTGSRYTHRTDEQEIKKLYDRVRKESNISLPVAYDSVLFHRFDVGPCPYIVVVDPHGIVRAITTDIDQRQFTALLRGKKPKFDKAVNRKGI
ncbi:MAG: TlpA disulfide reductase family protein [Mucilaginibacter sp.]|jgi:thiol-disulfide isomerase/thioredoxin|uniref:TlpA disulfide reductase family protein n=1 Tax=Mucilaginibacter sp. TaxID=1882438 RepID=UPI0035624C3C